MRQYKTNRSPKEPLFRFGRCLGHFAIDPQLVYVTTHLQGDKTFFLPFHKGQYGGAGNPPVPDNFATHYLVGRSLDERQPAQPAAAIHPHGCG